MPQVRQLTILLYCSTALLLYYSTTLLLTTRTCHQAALLSAGEQLRAAAGNAGRRRVAMDGFEALLGTCLADGAAGVVYGALKLLRIAVL